MQIAVDHQRRRVVAGAEADDRQQREAAIGARLAQPDAEPSKSMLAQALGAQHPAGDAVADENHVLADRLAKDHVVKGRDAVELVGLICRQRGDVRKALVGYPAAMPLDDLQSRRHRRRGCRVMP